MKNILDLQLFTYDPQAQPSNWTGAQGRDGHPEDAHLTPEMKTFYEKELIRAAAPNLVHDQFGQKKPIPKGSGKKIEFRKFAKLPKITAPLTEGVTPDGQNLRVENIEATVSQYGGFVALTDMLDLTAIDNVIVETTRLIGDQAGVSIDTVVRNVLQSGTNVSYADKIVDNAKVAVTERGGLDATAKLTVDGVEKVVTKLKRQNAKKINGSYVAIVHPDVVYDLRRDPDFIRAVDYGRPEDLYKSEVGELAGVRFVESSEAKIFKGADLASDSATLTVNGAVSAGADYITFDGGTVVADALIGRKIQVDGKTYTVTDNDTSKIYVEETLAAIADNKVIYAGEGGKENMSVYGCLFLGADAYGTTEVEGGGLEVIVKQKGSAGSSDPLDQRSTVGWKATKVAEILLPENLVRFECTSSYSADAKAN